MVCELRIDAVPSPIVAPVRWSLGLQCGLDTSKKVQTPLDQQVSIFTAQLELGKELKRPISVSSAGSWYK